MMDFFKQTRAALAALCALVLLALSACGGLPRPVADTPAPPTPPPQEVASTPTPEPQRLLPQIDSSTARIPITNAIYALFTGTYGYTGPEPLASKTHTAWCNLADGVADIVFLVAPTKDEMAYFAQRVVDIEMKVYGCDGLVFMGNASNPVDNLTTKQIRDIYSGKVTNWRDLGGPNAAILVYIRNAESGSQRLFESLVWDGYVMPDFSRMDFTEGDVNPTVTKREVKIYGDMGEVTNSVLLNQYAIGFNIMSYIDSEFDTSALKLFSVDGYAPTTENFASRSYPYLTTSYVAIRADEPEGSPARQLFDWVGSEESRRLIAENSTLAVTFSEPEYIRADSSPAWPIKLPEVIVNLDKRYFERQELLPYTLAELAYLRNGVFALSGKIFKTQQYAQFFGALGWYEGVSPSDSVITKKFNDYQKKNLQTILDYEKELNQALANQ